MKKIFNTIISVCSIALFSAVTSCNHSAPPKKDITEDDFLWKNIDSTVSPGADFFKFATGTWMKNNPIPASERGWGIYNQIQDETYDRIRKVCEEAATSSPEKGTNMQKLGDFWTLAMDSVKSDKEGIEPLKPELARIEQIKDKQGVLNVIALYQTYGIGPLIPPAPYQDEKNSEKYIMHLYQGGIGLPNRDYYFDNDGRSKMIRGEYIKFVTNMFKLMGEDESSAKKHSETIMQLETDLARASRKLEDLRDPYKNYNKRSLDELDKMTPSINWKTMFTQMHGSNIDTVVVGQPEFYTQVEKSLKAVSVDDWKTYLRWCLINHFAEYLSSAFDNEQFHFYRTIMAGVEKQRPRWKRTLDNIEGFMGDMLGDLYVKKYVPSSMKERYTKLVDNMMETYAERIQELDWMSNETKEKSLAKLQAVTKKVCYPDKFRDYKEMTIDRSSYVQNVIKAGVWNYNYGMNKLNKPVDRTEWNMTPQTYNAYYNPSNNEIVLPAAIFLIPGLPDSLADDAIIYGYAAASTIGHEITHGFDDEGRQFDAKGNLTNWWTKEDEEKFKKKADLMIEQFNKYTVLDSLHINGKATLGENIADLGGIVIGYAAFKKTEEGKKDTLIDGFTPDQRYFLGYTLGWLGHRRPESLAMQVKVDVHSPNFLRVNGPFSDVPEFYSAFNIKDGDPMWLPDSLRVKIW